MPPFVVISGDIAERRVSASAVVGGLDEVADFSFCLASRGGPAPIEEFALPCGEETLSHGVVEAVADGRPRTTDVACLAEGSESDGRILYQGFGILRRRFVAYGQGLLGSGSDPLGSFRSGDGRWWLSLSCFAFTILSVILQCGCGRSTEAGHIASSVPQLGASFSQVGSVWAPEIIHGSYCESRGRSCSFRSKNAAVSVWFRYRRRYATQFLVDFHRNVRRRDRWEFLRSLLPRGAENEECKLLRWTVLNSGPARACEFRWAGRTVLVVLYLAPPEDSLYQDGVEIDQGIESIDPLATRGARPWTPPTTSSPSGAWWAHIGDPESVIRRHWRGLVDDYRTPDKCIVESPFVQCDYKTDFKRVEVSVGFKGSRRYADDFVTYNYSDTGAPVYWSMLMRFLPATSKRLTCRDIQRTGAANGPAHVCIFARGDRLTLVVQYVNPDRFGKTYGEVAEDEGFDYVEAAKSL